MNKGYQRLFLVGLTLAWMLAVLSCKTPASITKGDVEEKDAEMLMEKLKLNAFSFTDLSARFSASFSEEKGKKTSFSGQIRMLHDSLIWVSVSPLLGIEVFRIMFSPDSVFIMNRLEKSYFRESFDFVSRFANATLDFDMLQSLLLGNDFKTYEATNLKASLDDGIHKLSIAARKKTITPGLVGRPASVIPFQDIWVDPGSFKIVKTILREEKSGGRVVQADYSKFNETDGKNMPSYIWIKMEGDKTLNLEIEYSKISVNEGIDFPFKVPGGYQVLP